MKTIASSVGTVAIAGCSGSSAPETAYFVVDYFHSWRGSVLTGGSQRSISGEGLTEYSVENPTTISGNAQKTDGSSRELTVKIRGGGAEIVAQASTSSPYGLAQISHTF